MKTSNIHNKKSEYILFVLPALIPFVIFFLFPFISSIYYSFFKWNGISDGMEFIGLQNYIEMFTSDAYYQHSISFTMKYALINMVLVNVCAMALALFLNLKLKTRNILRSIFFIPNVISPIIVGFIFRFIYLTGSVNMYQLTGIGFFNTNWLGTSDNAMFSIAIANLWQSVGYIMVIYLAGLQTIDAAYIEAADIDGCGPIQRFFYITLPMMMPSLTVNLFIVTAAAFKSFDMNIALTNGGPGTSTTTLALGIYREAFFNNRLGYASAGAFVLFLIVATITFLQVSFTKKREVVV